MIFYLGTHRYAWLGRYAIPMMVSHRTLRPLRSLPRARTGWVLDSGGFTEVTQHGGWTQSAREYAAAVRRYRDEIGNLTWAAPQDWMVENVALCATGLSLEEHQRRTVDNFLELRSIAPELPIIPVLQGWRRSEYLTCVEMYEKAGVRLIDEPVVGVGTMCRRQNTMPAFLIVQELREMGLRLHGFGVKTQGLELYQDMLDSADSLAWSFDARKEPPLPGHKHQHCNNCPVYAMLWRRRTLRSVLDSNQEWRDSWSSRTIRRLGDEARARAQLPEPRLFIGQSQALGRLASIEGEPWLDSQQDPELRGGFFQALRAWQRSEGRPSTDVEVISGEQGRNYAVMPSGEILMLTRGDDPEIAELSRSTLRLAP